MRRRVRDVWTATGADCTCLGEPVVRDSQDEEDQSCPYCLCQEGGGDMADVRTKCQNPTCSICMLVNKLDQPTITALGLKRNQRLAAMLEFAPLIAQCLNGGQIPEDRRILLCKALEDILSCSATRLRYIANAGMLVMLRPRLQHLLLQRGWGDVWCNLSKIASAIGHHSDHHSQIAALMYIRRRCIPESNNRWLWFLQPEDPTEEEEIDRTVFQ